MFCAVCPDFVVDDGRGDFVLGDVVDEEEAGGKTRRIRRLKMGRKAGFAYVLQ